MGKSKCVKPTRSQKKAISAAGLDPKDWLVMDEDDHWVYIVHRSSGKSGKVKAWGA